MNFALTSLGFLFAICAVADAGFSSSVSQSPSGCNPSCSTQSGSDCGCTSPDLQTMCSTLSLLSGSTLLNIGSLVDICVEAELFVNLTAVQIQALANADVLLSHSAPSKAGSSQYESLVDAEINALAKIEIPLIGDNKSSLATVFLQIVGNFLSGSGSNSGTGCSQAGQSTNILSIVAQVFTSLGLTDEDSKSASNSLINAIVGLDANLSVTVGKIVSSLNICVSGDISALTANIYAAITAVIGGGTSTSGAACSNAGDSSSLLDVIAAVLLDSGKSQCDSSRLATIILHLLVEVQLSGTSLLSSTVNAAVVVL